MSDGLKSFLVAAVLIGLFFFTPRKVPGQPSYPAGPGTKALGVFLLLLLVLIAALSAVMTELGLRR
jgi:hypothetical protein